MLHILKILLVITIQYNFIQCSIPTLKVSKTDRKVIARKRQDTLDMCRIFAESEKLGHDNNPFATKTVHHKNIPSRRYKRAVDDKLTPMLSNDAQRIEKIVDKLYDDVTENGQKVTYRHRILETTTMKSGQTVNNDGRRYNFAPAELLGPEERYPPRNQPPEGSPGYPWHKKWKHAIVPYFIDSKTYDSDLAEIIVKAFDYFEKATCIRLQRLRERPTDRQSLQEVEWLYITNPSGIRQCVHSNERKRNIGVQMVIFGYDCLSVGEIAHEIMHVLGFSHEHTRPDRDQYITVFWDNIKPGYKKYFQVRPKETLTNFPYDYASVLHYPKRAFSRNGQSTIFAETGVKLGQRDGLSEIDVEKVGLVFGSECVDRNKQYLLKTCPSVVKSTAPPVVNLTDQDIMDYFKPRLWDNGIVVYKLKDKMEFSKEERENIKAVIRHIQKETCIQFKEILSQDNEETEEEDDPIVITVPGPSNERDSSKANDDEKEQLPETENEINSVKEISDNNIASESSKEASDGVVDETETRRVINDTKTNETPKPSTNQTEFKRVRRAIRRINSRRHAKNILVLTRSPEPGCVCPKPGQPDGNQILKIHAECFNSVNDLLHLFVHVLGLDHQHNMHDRDSYLHILWDNLTEDVKNEMKNKLPPAASAGFTYDYQSVMHYPWLQIKNGVTNIMYPIWNDGWAMGHWQGLSSTDVQKINLLYYQQCFERKKQSKPIYAR